MPLAPRLRAAGIVRQVSAGLDDSGSNSDMAVQSLNSFDGGGSEGHRASMPSVLEGPGGFFDTGQEVPQALLVGKLQRP